MSVYKLITQLAKFGQISDYTRLKGLATLSEKFTSCKYTMDPQ